MAAPRGHPFVAFALGRLNKTRRRPVFQATGPNFLTSAIKHYISRPGFMNASATTEERLRESKITIHPMPALYPSQWNKRNPCCHSYSPRSLAYRVCPKSEAEYDACASMVPNSTVNTFWTSWTTWKPTLQQGHKTAGR